MAKLTKEKALELLETTTKQAHLLQHATAVSAAMGAMAQHFNEDVPYWQAIGILHDYDYEEYPEEHLMHTETPLQALGVDDESIRAILAHGFGLCNEIEPKTKLEKSLFTVDELTGLISATARMRPNGISDLEVASVKKKFKDKRFAAKINRDVIKQGAELLGLELAQIIEICINGMRPVAKELGILGSGG